MIASSYAPATIAVIKKLADDIHGRLNALSSSNTYNPDGSSALDSSTLESIDDTLAHSLAKLRMLRNTQASVNSLPPEILTTIFGILAGPRALSSTSPLEAPGTVDPKEWIPVTHVCRYWRDAALGYPFMWNPIVFAPPDIDDESSLPYECLQRSVGAPLDVQVKCDGATEAHVWEKLAARCDRLRKLHVVNLTEFENLLRFNNEAPLLESLCIQVSDKVLDRRISGEAPLFSDELPLLFGGHMPSLRYLTLAFFTRFAPGNRFTNLTHLHVSDQEYATPHDLTPFLSLLKANPNLQEFIVERCEVLSPNDDHITSADDEFIAMPHLQRLSFESCHATLISIFLFRLELSGHGVAITCRDWWPSERHIASIFPAKMRSRIYPLQDVTKLDLTYDTSEIRAVSPTSATHIKFENDLDVIDNIAPGLRLVLSFHALNELWLSGIELHSWQFWQDAFGAMPALHKLVLGLTPTDPDKWLRALTSEDLNGKPYPAPLLSKLYIFPPFPDISATLVSMLETRSQDGHRLHAMHVLCESNIRSEEIRREFVGWKDQRAVLEEFADEVRFEMVPKYPHIDVPEACRSFIS